jgi:hypothetical protein
MSFAILTLFGGLVGAATEQKKPDEVIVAPRTGDTKHLDLFDGKTLEGWQGTPTFGRSSMTKSSAATRSH